MPDTAGAAADEVRRLLVSLIPSVQPRWHAGAVTPIAIPHTTQWRVLAEMVSSYLEGGEVTIEFTDRPTVRILPGTSWCLPPGIPHCATLVTPGQACSIWSHVSFRLLGAIDLTQIIRPPLQYVGEPAEHMLRLNRELAELGHNRQRSVAQQVRFQALLHEFLALIMDRAEPGERARFLPDLLRMRPVLDGIAADLAADYSVPMLAAQVDLAPVQFTLRFKRALGCTPMAYVQQQRLEAARLQLLQSSRPVHAIAEGCGFADQYHFSRAFKRAFGLSPRGYRERVSATAF